MENVRYRVAATPRRNKEKSWNTNETSAPTLTLNTVVSGRQAPSVGDNDNYHPGRRQRSRRRDVYAAPDDFVRPSPPVTAVFDAVRRDVDSSDIRPKSPQLWAQPTFVAGSGAVARSRSRPRPPFLLERGVQRGEISGEYVANAVDRSRFSEHQLTEEPRHRQRQPRQQQQQQHQRVAGLHQPPVEFAARCAVDGRPQFTPTPSSVLPGRTVTSPAPAPLSPSYFNDNKTLLKEALISAATAKLARSSSARSAVVKPLVVIRNGPNKSSSDEHVDADNDVMTTTTTTVKSLVTSDGPALRAAVESPEHATDVAVAAAAAAAAAATRRSRTRRRDAEQLTASGVTTTSAALPVTSLTDSAGTRRTRTVNSNTVTGNEVSRTNVAVSPLSAGITMQDGAGCHVATDVNSYVSPLPSAAVQTSPSSNPDYPMGESQRSAVLMSTPGITVAGAATRVSEKQDKTKTVDCSAGDLQQSTSDARSNDRSRRDENKQRVDRSMNDSKVTDPDTIVDVADTGTRQELPSSSSKVSFIKSILSRTRSPSPSRYRRSRSKVQHTSPSPASMKRLGAEVAQRISEPVKGYLKQLRDRSSQRRRPADSATASSNAETAVEPEPSDAREQAQASIVDRQTRPGELAANSGDRHTEDSSSGGRRRFKTETKQQENATSALTSQWKSTSELTTPMSRLDNLLKANSLQHLRTSTNKPTADKPSGDQTSSSTQSRLPLPSKTSKSTGCLLTSPANSGTQQPTEQRPRATTMSRCYLEKPPRVARRAMTVQLDRRTVDGQTPPLGVTERHSTSQADLRNLPLVENGEPADSSSKLTTNDISKRSMLATTMTSVSAVTRQLQTARNHAASSERERDLRELYEQKRLERQLEEKLALMEKERAEMIAKLWSQIDHRCETNSARQRTTGGAAVSDQLSNASSSPGLVLPLSSSSSATSPTEHNNNQVVNDPLGDLLIELSSTPTTNRWSERRRAARSSTTALRPRAASCSRRFMSDSTTAADAAAALTSKSQSHTQLHRNPSSCSDVGHADSSPVHLRQRSHQQLLPQPSSRPLTCYLPARDRHVDLHRFIESAGHRLDQCDHVQLTSTTCHGYLSKLAGNATVRLWKRRWFVFDTAQRCLHYYTDKTEKRADGTFIWFQTIQDVFVDHERRSRSPHPESTFCVKTVERPLFLVAPTPEAMRIWIDVIFTGAEGYQQFV